MQKLIITFFLLISVANAQEDTVINTQEIQNEIPFDKRVSVYLHPIFFFAGATGNADWLKSDTIYNLYVTIEVPINLSYSLIIRPSYLDGQIPIKSEVKFLSSDCYYGKRLGSDFGIRYYKNKKGKGFYLQGQIGLFYYNETGHKLNEFMGEHKNETYDKNYMWVDFMGYIGKEWQFGDRFRMFFDAGLGCAIIGGYPSGTGDINLGIGFKIGKNKK